MQFHSLQDSHFPAQRVVTAPQDWQTKEDRDLAMMGSLLISPLILPAIREQIKNDPHAV
jgi:hypothetical protein